MHDPRRSEYRGWFGCETATLRAAYLPMWNWTTRKVSIVGGEIGVPDMADMAEMWHTRREAASGRVQVVASQRELLEVVGATHPVGRLAHLLYRWNQQAYQHRDDGDDHQQFNQGETDTTGTMHDILSGR